MGTDHDLMEMAIGMAKRAKSSGQRPFGCLILAPKGRIIGYGSGTGRDIDPTAHSELIAIREACRHRRGLLEGCTLYSTHEPCIMCCGAIMHAHLSRVVWGSSRAHMPDLFHQREIDVWTLLNDTSNRRVTGIGGIMWRECVQLFADERRMRV